MQQELSEQQALHAEELQSVVHQESNVRQQDEAKLKKASNSAH